MSRRRLQARSDDCVESICGEVRAIGPDRQDWAWGFQGAEVRERDGQRGGEAVQIACFDCLVVLPLVAGLRRARVRTKDLKKVI